MTSKRRQVVRRRAGHRGGAFSLIEVLLGVLILALGLLGLAAVMPAVVAQQRNAANTTLGVSATESAKVYIKGRPDLNRLGGQSVNQRRGLGVLWYDLNWSEDFEWEVPDEIDPETGLFELGPTASTAVRIPVGERLWPPPNSGRGGPVFVWDVVFRRVPPASNATILLKPEIEVAIFVRRVDSAIRTNGQPVWQVLMSDDVHPVAEDENTGLPTANGLGVYSIPRRMDVVFEELPSGERDRIRLVQESAAGFGVNAASANDETLKDLLSRPGQKIVDNLGNVYTVTGVDDELEDTIIVDPPVPTSARETNDGGAEEYRTLHQLVFTPQIPAAVEVFRLRAANPKE